jgi:hypothetical protein
VLQYTTGVQNVEKTKFSPTKHGPETRVVAGLLAPDVLIGGKLTEAPQDISMMLVGRPRVDNAHTRTDDMRAPSKWCCCLSRAGNTPDPLHAQDSWRTKAGYVHKLGEHNFKKNWWRCIRREPETWSWYKPPHLRRASRRVQKLKATPIHQPKENGS